MIQRHQIDAIAFDQVTKSPYISNVYASCGKSEIFEWSSTDMSQIFVTEPQITKEEL